MSDILQQAKQNMLQAIEHFKAELKGLRAGRASTTLLEGVPVDVYGSQMRLKEIASFTTPEPRQITIMPFDASNCKSIEQAIGKANLGVRAVLEGKSVRVFFPELDGNRRKELVNQIHKELETCKIVIRNVRRDHNELLKKAKNEIPEDDAKRIEKQIQEATDKACKDADDVAHSKEKEIMTV